VPSAGQQQRCHRGLELRIVASARQSKVLPQRVLTAVYLAHLLDDAFDRPRSHCVHEWDASSSAAYPKLMAASTSAVALREAGKRMRSPAASR
jgi:hypothetical protein